MLIVIAERLAGSSVPSNGYKLLSDDERILRLGSAVAWLAFVLISRVEPSRADISDMSESEVRSRLESFLGGAQKVYVLWMSTWEVARVDASVLVDSYDEFWLPGADDVLIQVEPGRQTILLDHEEGLWQFGPS